MCGRIPERWVLCSVCAEWKNLYFSGYCKGLADIVYGEAANDEPSFDPIFTRIVDDLVEVFKPVKLQTFIDTPIYWAKRENIGGPTSWPTGQ